MKRSQSGLAKQAGSAKRPRTESSYQTSSSGQSKLGTAYDPAFEQKFKDNGVFMDDSGPKPNNWTDIQTRLARPRRSLSPTQFSDSEFAKFKEANGKATTETTTITDAFFLYIAGTTNILSQKDVVFNNLQDWPMKNIKQVKPDSYDGSDPSDLRLGIREMLSESIEPSTDKSRPILANCFKEGKGVKGSPLVLRQQALRDGGEGGRAMIAIRTYIDPETAYDGNAYTMAATYHPEGGLLILYTVHAVAVTGKPYPAEYRMRRLNIWIMDFAPEAFREGATWLRNGRDLMKEYRDGHIALANNKFQTQQAAAADQAVQAPSPAQPLANTQPHVLVAVPPPQPVPPQSAHRKVLRPRK
ncbi:MAG: hypothetical protein LQ346_003392 [Caloplaca aetnensis]|nr:MAG: hypothetical protein LQ346_003392 [Caloplaca aetnensis]